MRHFFLAAVVASLSLAVSSQAVHGQYPVNYYNYYQAPGMQPSGMSSYQQINTAPGMQAPGMYQYQTNAAQMQFIYAQQNLIRMQQDLLRSHQELIKAQQDLIKSQQDHIKNQQDYIAAQQSSLANQPFIKTANYSYTFPAYGDTPIELKSSSPSTNSPNGPKGGSSEAPRKRFDAGRSDTWK